MEFVVRVTRENGYLTGRITDLNDRNEDTVETFYDQDLFADWLVDALEHKVRNGIDGVE